MGFHVASSAGKAARQDYFASTTRQRQHDSIEAFFFICIQTKSTRRCAMQRTTCATNQTAMGLYCSETKPHRTAERRVNFFSSVTEFTRQRDEHGCNPRLRPHWASHFYANESDFVVGPQLSKSEEVGFDQGLVRPPHSPPSPDTHQRRL